MINAHYALGFHGRRSVDELIVARQSENEKVARLHRELSILHLDQFVATVRSAAEELDQPEPTEKSDDDG